mgnify:CR=1 FL=1
MRDNRSKARACSTRSLKDDGERSRISMKLLILRNLFFNYMKHKTRLVAGGRIDYYFLRERGWMVVRKAPNDDDERRRQDLRDQAGLAIQF